MSFVIVLSLCLSGGQFSHGHGKDQRRGTLIAVTVLYWCHRRPRPPPCGRSRQASASARRLPRAAARRLLPGGRARQSFAGLHLPAPQLNHIRPGGAGEEPRAAPSGPCQRVGICSAGIICNAGSLATLTISATDTPSAAASLQRIAMLIGGLFSISTSIPLLMLARRDSSSSDIFFALR